MATKKSSFTGFSQMPKMMTDEPSVILKLKKGGHVGMGKKSNSESGHMGMRDTDNSRKNFSEMGDSAEDGNSPMKPSMSERRKAMAAPMMMAKKGGKVGKEEKEIRKVEKELKKHEGEKASKAHKGLKSGGRAMDSFETKTTIEGNEKKYIDGKMMDGEKHDKKGGTGSIKEGETAGFKHGGNVTKHKEGTPAYHKAMIKHHKAMGKQDGSDYHEKMVKSHMSGMKKYAIGGSIAEGTGNKANKGRSVMGGTIEGNEKDYDRTDMHGTKRDTSSGTKGIKESRSNGYKMGGSIGSNGLSKASIQKNDFEDKPVMVTPKTKTSGETGAVRKGNAGGYKMGGSPKKHFASGGSVNNEGKATPMAKKAMSASVSNTKQSGTFKEGGHIKKFAEGSTVVDGMAPERKNKGSEISAMKRLLGMPLLSKKRGGGFNC